MNPKQARPIIWALMALGLSLIALQLFAQDTTYIEINRQLDKQRQILASLQTPLPTRSTVHGHPPQKLVRPNFQTEAGCWPRLQPLPRRQPTQQEQYVNIDYQKLVQCMTQNAQLMAAIKGQPGATGPPGEITSEHIAMVVAALSEKLVNDETFKASLRGEDGKGLKSIRIESQGAIVAQYNDGTEQRVGTLPTTPGGATKPKTPATSTPGEIYFDLKRRKPSNGP